MKEPSAKPRPLIEEKGESQRSLPRSSPRSISLEEKEVSSLRSLVSAPLKGAIKEIFSYPMPIDPELVEGVEMPEGVSPREYLEKGQKEFREKFPETIEKVLPTRDEVPERYLERFGKLAMYGNLPRAAVAAGTGTLAEEMGAGLTGQSIAEIVGLAGPSLARRIVPATSQQRELLKLGRERGLSERQLAPLISTQGKQRFWGKMASKGEGAQQDLRGTERGISSIYNWLRGTPAATEIAVPLESPQSRIFVQEMRQIGRDIPAAIRNQITADLSDLVQTARRNKGLTGDALINFYHDISSKYNLGRTQLERFKGPVVNLINSIDPTLARDFQTANNMWARMSRIQRTLRPGQYEGLIDAGKSAAATAALATGHFGFLSKLLGVQAFRRFSREMLTNPRLQNLVRKSQNAILQNRLPLIKKTGEELIKTLEEKEED